MKHFILKNQNNFITLFFTIFAIYAIHLYGIKYLLLSFASYYLIWVVLHPCWWHVSLWHWGLIKTNKYVHNFHVFLYCFYFPFKPSAPMLIHLKHHKLCNTDSDRNTFKVNQGRLKHLFNLTVPPLRTDNKKRFIKNTLPDLPFWKWCDKNHLKIFYVTNIILFCIFFKYYIFLHAIPYVIGRAELLLKLHDITWHYKPEKNFKNKPYMFFIFFCDAWHKDHHEENIILNFGPGIFKWINPQFWYFCLISPDVRKQTLNFNKHYIVH